MRLADAVAIVTAAADVHHLVDSVVRRFGKLTMAVNNARLSVPGTVIDIDAEQWDNVFRTNVRPAYLVSHHAMPHLLERRSGSVINISSEVGPKGLKNRSACCAAKGVLVGLTKAMAVDHSGSGIRIKCICPGRSKRQWSAGSSKIMLCAPPRSATVERSVRGRAGFA